MGRLISLSGTEEIMQNLVKITHSTPICEFRDDILSFASVPVISSYVVGNSTDLNISLSFLS